MANTILNLSAASAAGAFTSKTYNQSTQSWDENTQDNARWYTNSELTDYDATGDDAIANVTASDDTMKLTFNKTYGTDVTTVNAGGSADKWVINDANTSSLKEITGSRQDDTFNLTVGGETVTTGAGNDTINIVGLGKAATVTDYAYGYDVIQVSSVTNPGTLISNAGLVNGGGKDSLQLNATNGYYAATLTDGSNKVNVWQGGSDASRMDASAEKSELVMTTGASSDTLIGGSKGDSIFANAEGNYVDGGKGADSIVLDAARTARQYVAFGSGTGADEVTYFGTGHEDSADVLVLTDGAITDVKFTLDTTKKTNVIKSGSGSVSLDSAATDVLMQEGSGDIAKVQFVANDATILVTADDEIDYYLGAGKTAKVDYSAIDDDVIVDLGDSSRYAGGASFKGVNSVIGGTGNSTLVGSGSTKNYLVSGGGNTTLWGGGASNDVLSGNSAVGTADAFFVGQGDGKDTIVGFDAVSEDGADALYMMNSPVASIKRDNTGAKLTFADGSSVMVKDNGNYFYYDTALSFTLDGSNFQTAKIGMTNADNNFTYDDSNMYFGGNKADTLEVASSFEGNSVDIRLNNTLDQTYSSIEGVDAHAYEGNAFISGSDEASEVLVGAQGNTTLWGGLGAAGDTLVGTSGSETDFFFGQNNGADVITSSDSDDKVVFYDFANTDLTAIDTSGNQLKFTFNDGSSLQVQNYSSNSVQTFEFNNSKWTYDNSTKEFTQIG